MKLYEDLTGMVLPDYVKNNLDNFEKRVKEINFSERYCVDFLLRVEDLTVSFHRDVTVSRDIPVRNSVRVRYEKQYLDRAIWSRFVWVRNNSDAGILTHVLQTFREALPPSLIQVCSPNDILCLIEGLQDVRCEIDTKVIQVPILLCSTETPLDCFPDMPCIPVKINRRFDNWELDSDIFEIYKSVLDLYAYVRNDVDV